MLALSPRRLRRPAIGYVASLVGGVVRAWKGSGGWVLPSLVPIFGAFPSPRTSIPFAQTFESHEVPKISGGRRSSRPMHVFGEEAQPI